MHKLQFALLFLLFAFTLQELPHSPKEAEERENFVKSFNDLRRARAKVGWIPYMHELVYDENLYKHSMHDQGVSCFSLHDYIVFTKEVRDLLAKNQSRVLEVPYEFVDAYQKKVRCIKHEDKFRCCLGPLKIIYIASYFTAAPGSMCDDGYYNNDGLCSLIPTTTAAPTTTMKITPETPDNSALRDDDYDEDDCMCISSTQFKVFQILLIFVFWLFPLV
ncbi:unnamed protein product [Caenorhabditis brenneri]